MKRATFLATIAAALAAACPLAAIAHHSFAMFDQSKNLTLQGTVRKFEWTNPHAFVLLEVSAKGKSQRYVLECSSPALMRHAGWTFKTLKTGDRVTVNMHPLRNGQAGDMLKTIKLPSGKTLKAW